MSVNEVHLPVPTNLMYYSRNTEAALYPERVEGSQSTQQQPLPLPVLRDLNTSNLFYGTWHPHALLMQRISLL